MNNAFRSAAALVSVVTVMAASPARAERVDASTISCQQLSAAYESKSKSDISFINGILNWMGGYHATEEQGTVVDWKKLSDAFDKTVAYCAKHPKIGVMSASEKFMGEHIAKAGPDASDLALVTCETALTDSNITDNIGDVLLWLAGYHTSTNKESTILDLDKFVEETSQIVDFCVANPQTGLFTASEKFMSETD